MAAIPLEVFGMGLESVRGQETTNWRMVAVTDGGIIKPGQDTFRPEESVGLLTNNYRSAAKRRWAEWEFDAALDVYLMRYLLAMALGYPPTVSNEAEPRTEVFKRYLRGDNLKSSSLVWGDPSVEIYRGLYGMLDELTISYDATGDEGATVSASGKCQYPDRLGKNTAVAQGLQPDLAPLLTVFRAWIDPVSNPYGTTEVTDRVLSFETKVVTEVGYKHYGSRGLGFKRTDRGRSHPETSVNIEFLDPEFYAMFEQNRLARFRFALESNDPIPETDQYYSIAFDFLTTLEFDDWGDHENTRTDEYTLHHAWDNTIETDLLVTVTSDKTAILE